jgi:hypothetical protein
MFTDDFKCGVPANSHSTRGGGGGGVGGRRYTTVYRPTVDTLQSTLAWVGPETTESCSSGVPGPRWFFATPMAGAHELGSV